jgi:signal transduction histidine kinase/DNA-binding LacI/PurR family transcriptional regulator/AraC-like DNA-binding protein
MTCFRNEKPTIGVLAGWQFYRTATNFSYLAPVFRGISKAAQDMGCNLLLGCGIGPSASPTDPLRPAWPDPLPEVDFAPIGPWNTDALLVANPLHTQARSDYIQSLIGEGRPVLFIGSGEIGPTIVADNSRGIREAMQHLVDHGHRKIAFIAGSRTDLCGDSGNRLTAYQNFIEKHSPEVDPRLITYGRHVYDGGYSAMQELLNNGTSFTAVLASNDESALGAMQALEEAGRKIPGDVAVIGFDNRLEGAAHEPGLSSVHVSLFDMGYQALKHLYEHLQGKPLAEVIKVNTRLVTRASCGCGDGDSLRLEEIRTESQLVNAMTVRVMSRAHSLAEEECQRLCQSLADGFAISVREGDGEKFKAVLRQVVEGTTVGEEDASVWQEAVALLGVASQVSSASTAVIQELMKEAQALLSRQMQNQHRNYVLRERWTSSRMSLLTDRLLDALDETQIYDILAQHLPDLGIDTAMLALFEADEADPVAWSNIHNIFESEEVLHIPSREFPTQAWTNSGKPFRLTLIPLVAYSGQLGFMVFGAEHLDLYGAIVQQLGGAFNTARLYRQAVEGWQAAEEANRMKSRFLSTISHELRTPLNLIVGLSGILLQENEEGELPLSEPVQKDVERIQAYAQHLGGLIGDVLDLTTSDAGQLRLNMDFVDLGQALRMVTESGRQLAYDKGLKWNVCMPEEGAWVWGDVTRLRQVVLNLVNNAIKFTEQGAVSFSMEVVGGTVTVKVHDTGLGISPQEQETIFSQFSRSERSIQLGYKGLGLGLAICKRLVELHDGEIEVHSTGQAGEGSTFYFNLPIVEPPREVVKNPRLMRDIDETEPGKSIKEQAVTILVVDNEPNTLDLHTRIVQSHSMSNRVLKARSGVEALEFMMRESVDLVLLDLQMPEMDGFEVLEKMHAQLGLKAIPVIVVTGQTLTEVEMARLSRGVASVLEKGLFNVDETVAHIRSALEGRRRLSGEAQRLVRKAMAYIHENFSQPISRRDIAGYVNIAEDYLTFCFRQELGTTPIKYLQRYRVNRAKELIKGGPTSITEIARLVGFADSGYFSRIFHRETGMSPEAFRREPK